MAKIELRNPKEPKLYLDTRTKLVKESLLAKMDMFTIKVRVQWDRYVDGVFDDKENQFFPTEGCLPLQDKNNPDNDLNKIKRGEAKTEHLKKIQRKVWIVKNKVEQALGNDRTTINQFEFNKRYKGETSSDQLVEFRPLIEEVIAEKYAIGKIRTGDLYRDARISLEKFNEEVNLKKAPVKRAYKKKKDQDPEVPAAPIDLRTVTEQWLKNYEIWYTAKPKIRNGKKIGNNSLNTAAMHLRGLRRAMKLALKRGLITQAQYPFADEKFDIRTERKKKKSLSKENILKFLAYTPTKKSQIKAHDFTVFSYLCNGMNFADIANLPENAINFDHFNFIREKTKDTVKQRKEILVALTARIKAIISRQRIIGSSFLFGIISDQDDARTRRRKIDKFILNTNRAIKTIAKKLGFEENITTYSMRHTFVTILLNNGVPLTKIADALGHMSVVTTAIYAEDLDFDTAKLFGNYLEGTTPEESPTPPQPQPQMEKAA